jgi:FkbM family methyltransferase
MTIGTLLNNTNIKAVAIDPNRTAINSLEKSLKYNHLQDRGKVINAVAGDYDGTINFDNEESVIGHVSENGIKTNVVKISSLLNRYSEYKTLVKIDIEGYESKIIDELTLVNNIKNFRFIIELHEAGFNDVGNPQYVFNKFRKLNATISDFSGNVIRSVPQDAISQISVTFN